MSRLFAIPLFFGILLQNNVNNVKKITNTYLPNIDVSNVLRATFSISILVSVNVPVINPFKRNKMYALLVNYLLIGINRLNYVKIVRWIIIMTSSLNSVFPVLKHTSSIVSQASANAILRLHIKQIKNAFPVKYLIFGTQRKKVVPNAAK